MQYLHGKPVGKTITFVLIRILISFFSTGGANYYRCSKKKLKKILKKGPTATFLFKKNTPGCVFKKLESLLDCLLLVGWLVGWWWCLLALLLLLLFLLLPFCCCHFATAVLLLLIFDALLCFLISFAGAATAAAAIFAAVVLLLLFCCYHFAVAILLMLLHLFYCNYFC